MMTHHNYLFIGLGLTLLACIWLFWRHSFGQGTISQVLGTVLISGALTYGFFWVFKKSYAPYYKSINTVSIYTQPFYSIGDKLFIIQDGSYEEFTYVEASTPNNIPILVRRIYPKPSGQVGTIYNTVYHSKSAMIKINQVQGK